MYCPHDDMGSDDADDGEVDRDGDPDQDWSTGTVAAASASSISQRRRSPPSKNPFARGKAWLVGKWGRLMTSGGTAGVWIWARAARIRAAGTADSPSAAAGSGCLEGRGRWRRNWRAERRGPEREEGQVGRGERNRARSHEVILFDAARGRRV
jgi:hypothetical protein